MVFWVLWSKALLQISLLSNPMPPEVVIHMHIPRLMFMKLFNLILEMLEMKTQGEKNKKKRRHSKKNAYLCLFVYGHYKVNTFKRKAPGNNMSQHQAIWSYFKRI